MDVTRGTTALHLAVQAGHVEVARLLLAHGADTDIMDAAGATAREYAMPGTPMDDLFDDVMRASNK